MLRLPQQASPQGSSQGVPEGPPACAQQPGDRKLTASLDSAGHLLGCCGPLLWRTDPKHRRDKSFPRGGLNQGLHRDRGRQVPHLQWEGWFPPPWHQAQGALCWAFGSIWARLGAQAVGAAVGCGSSGAFHSYCPSVHVTHLGRYLWAQQPCVIHGRESVQGEAGGGLGDPRWAQGLSSLRAVACLLLSAPLSYSGPLWGN